MISSAPIGEMGSKYTSGIDTQSGVIIPGEVEDTSPIVFWAGAVDNGISQDGGIANAPFKVTRNGTVYASKGVFEGTIIGSLVKSSVIIGKNVRSPSDSDKQNGLSILGNGGITLYGGVVPPINGEVSLEACNAFIAANTPSLVITPTSLYTNYHNSSLPFMFRLSTVAGNYFSIDSSEKTLYILKEKIGSYLIAENSQSTHLSFKNAAHQNYLNISEMDTETLSIMVESSYRFGSDKRVYQDVVKNESGETVGYDLYVTE